MFKKYIEYLKDNPEGYWFKRKCYGWGWVPATREGFAVLGAYLFVIVFLAGGIDTMGLSQGNIMSVLSPFVIATILLLTVCYKKGESPRWQWGTKDVDLKSKK